MQGLIRAGEASFSLADVVAISEEAGAAIMRIYGNEEEWHVQRKEDDSPLTAADLAAHNVIVHGLQRIAPSIPILSEEGTVPPSGVRQTWDHAFVVDPLDGTKEFLRRNGQFTVNIALVSRGPNGKHVPVMGVVSVPAQGSTYWGSTGAGAFVKDSEGTRPIRCVDETIATPGLKIVSSASHMSSETAEFIERAFQSPSHKQVGSSIKLLLVASGEAHCYPRLAPTSEWDTAAADAIVRAAGGRVIQAGGPGDWKDRIKENVDVEYNKFDTILNPWFIVAPPRICKEIAALDW